MGTIAQNRGAKSVIATLWSVDDDGTRAMMREFYRAADLMGVKSRGAAFPYSPDRPHAHPYYWAPFILIGNWR